MLNQIIKVLKNEGFEGILFRIKIRLIRKFPKYWSILSKKFPARSKLYHKHLHYFENKNGIEFGGKSNTFDRGGLFPIYPHASNVDNCNFGNLTYWEGSLVEGKNFLFNPKKKLGYQFIAEASNLGDQVEAKAYDFVMSCHMLEHSANPVKTLFEWKRILKNDGLLLLILPHKDASFDHKRPITKIEHMIEDYSNDVGEDDLTHLDEVLKLHDLEGDGFFENNGIDKEEQLLVRAKNNYDNRMIHHHVFSTKNALQLVDYVGFEIIDVEPCRINNIIIICKNSDVGFSNELFFKSNNSSMKNSPFVSDRM